MKQDRNEKDKKRENKARSKREMILDAAFSLILEKGYWETKIIDIAEAAGIGKGTVYEYFASKDEIVYELFQLKIETTYQNLSDVFTKEMTGEEKIKKYVQFELSFFKKFGFSKNFLMDLFLKSDAFQNHTLVTAIHKLIGRKITILTQIIEEGIKSEEFQKIDPMMAATAIMGAINSFITFDCCLTSPNIFQLDKNQHWDEEEFINLVFHGLKRKTRKLSEDFEG